MRRVSFNVAKALKEVGYPQKYGEGTMCYAEDGTHFEHDSSIEEFFPEIFCIAPTYMDVWLWLWREKGIKIDIISGPDALAILKEDSFCETDPEDAIIAAIDSALDYLSI